MPLPTLTWSKATQTTFTVVGAQPTIQEFLNKLETFVNTLTHWKVTAKVLDVTANLRGYIEIAPRSLTVGITEARALITYVGKVSAISDPAAANRMAPTFTLATSRTWAGISSNANTTGPNADPFVGLAYTAASWSKMQNLATALTDNPINGSGLGAIECEEALILYWYTASGMQYVTIGKLLEDPTGETAEWLAFLSSANWNSQWSSAASAYPVGSPTLNNSVAPVGYSKSIGLRNDNTLLCESWCDRRARQYE
jgi:hypothetical protein